MSIYRMRTEFGQHLKWVMLGIAAVFVVGAIFTFGAAPGGKNGRGTKGESDVIATVNGQPITRGDFEGVWYRVSEEARSQGQRSPLQYADYRAAIFAQMVQGRLILSKAEEMGIDVSDRKVKAEIDKEVVKALNANRESILGSELTKSERKLDPRKDKKYKDALASVQRSVGQMEEAIRAQIPTEDIRAKLAFEGIEKKIESGLKPVSDKDVKDSYNVYKIRQIVLMKGQMPEDQMKTRVDKIMKEIRSGGDFAKLAKENSSGPMGGDEAMDYSFDARWMFPTEVREAIQKLKQGGVTSPIETNFGTYIVKLESVTPKLPEKLDKKTKDERRKQIAEDRKMSALQSVQESMQESQKVDIEDPEMLAYWKLSQVRQAFGDQPKAKKLTTDAISALKKAHKTKLDNPVISSKLAQLLFQNGKAKEGLDILYPMLEGDTASVDSPDLRMLLGDMLMEQSKKEKSEEQAASIEKAMEQYEIAGESNDAQVHQQLANKYQQLGNTELAAAEQKWLADYSERMKALQAEQEKNAPKKTEDKNK